MYFEYQSLYFECQTLFFECHTLFFECQTLYHECQTLYIDAKLYTLNAKPYFWNATPCFLNAKPYTLNAKPYTLNDKLYTLNAKLYTLNAILNVKLYTLNALLIDLIARCIVSSGHFNTTRFDMSTKWFANAKYVDLKGKLINFTSKAIIERLTNIIKAAYKDLTHRINYCKLSLSGDIEVNPGPIFVNPLKTIHAPYSQGNVAVFGENAGRQFVPMSLCSLIHVYCNGSIQNSSDLVNIMKLGNELYSMLSRLSRQQYLLLRELPTQVTVEDTNYSFQLSESYTGNLDIPFMNETIFFVMPLVFALEK